MPLIKYIPLQTEHASMISEANILCLGNFDGVHHAHRALLRAAKNLQTEKMPGTRCGVFCFEKPSNDFLSPNPPKHLTTLEQKLSCFAEEGMDFALVADFEAMRDLIPHEFVNDILIRQCGCKAVVCGYNYRFGKRGAGDSQLLQELFDNNFVIVVPPIYMDGDTVSSTRIRKLLLEGKVKEANRLLSKPFSISAPVLHGKGLGRLLGAPTFNQELPEDMLIPKHGVYVTQCEVDGKVYRGVTNIGTHPTVDSNAKLNFETHLLDFEGDLYQKELTVSFLDYLRPEIHFETPEALQKQIQKDILLAKTNKF